MTFMAHKPFFTSLLVLFLFFSLPRAHAFLTDDAAYLKVVDPSARVTPILTAGESVPRTSNPVQKFRLVGIPDGMGLFRDAKNQIHLMVNHELKKTEATQPIADSPLLQGAFVSELLIRQTPIDVISGDLAATTILNGTSGQPITGSAGRFCSGFLADEKVGLDRPLYLAGEEASGNETFDGRGGQTFAIVAGITYPLPNLGRFQKENTIVVPGTGLKTVAFGLEDAPKAYNSQLYLYVGEKNLSSKNALERNGLAGGNLYALAADAPGQKDEGNFHKRDHAIIGRWIKIPNAVSLTDDELQKAAFEGGAFGFDRIEDGTYDRTQTGVFYFVTTGGDTDANRKGRLYRLTFDPQNPAGGRVVLEILLEGDAGDPIVNPDNIDMNASGDMLIQEDFTLDNYGTLLKRSPSIWLYRPGGQSLTRLAEVNGKFWESSGVLDASDAFGPGSWLVTVQAHTIGSAEASRRQGIQGDGYVSEGGQILLLQTR